MADPLILFDALREAAKSADARSAIRLSRWDSVDLQKLTAKNLVCRKYDVEIAARVSTDLASGSLMELGKLLGVELRTDPDAISLVPAIRLQETAGSLAGEEETLEEMFQQLDRIRHPERYAM